MGPPVPRTMGSAVSHVLSTHKHSGSRDDRSHTPSPDRGRLKEKKPKKGKKHKPFSGSRSNDGSRRGWSHGHKHRKRKHHSRYPKGNQGRQAGDKSGQTDDLSAILQSEAFIASSAATVKPLCLRGWCQEPKVFNLFL